MKRQDQNFVAKHMKKYNRPATMRDRKCDYSRKGKSKWHKET